MSNVEDLLGQTLLSVANIDNVKIIFTSLEGRNWKLYHEQDCCESVRIEEIIGHLGDLVNSPILMAEEVTHENKLPDDVVPEKDEYGQIYLGESFTWTFYKFATIKGYVTIRFLGTSNGYYSESVSFVEL
jgi:hypothetical protein